LDPTRAAQAIRAFLLALGLDPDSTDLEDTPDRVARAWLDVLAAGYKSSPEEALGEGFASKARAAVIAAGIPFVSVCPHHLLPLMGDATVAFMPAGRVPGFGRIAQLIDVLAHRLVLQEDLTQSIADHLARGLGAKAVIVELEAQHSCVAVTDPARQNVRFKTRAAVGSAAAIRALSRDLEGR
jgi:GTP cyclohydrolase I